MENISNNFELFKLMQPDLLTVNELCSVLQSRCVKIDCSLLSKEKLVELFNRVALPLPQREYPQTTRGLQLTRLRQKFQNTVKLGDSSESNEKTYKIGVNGIASSSNVKSISKDRLKPPPCIKMQCNTSGGIGSESINKTITIEKRKNKIKLNSSTENDLDKIIINDHKKQSQDSSREVTMKNNENEQGSIQNSIKNKQEVSTTQKITLKRNHFSSQVESEKSTDEQSEIVEKKRKTITWP